MNMMMAVQRSRTRKAAAHARSGFYNRNNSELLQRFGYMAGTNAAGTGLDGLDAAICYGSDFLEVWIPNGTGFIVGVAHIVAEAGPFSTDITFSRHIFSSK